MLEFYWIFIGNKNLKKHVIYSKNEKLQNFIGILLAIKIHFYWNFIGNKNLKKHVKHKQHEFLLICIGH